VRAWADEEATRSGLVVRAAKASIELHPPVPADKGSVVEHAAAGLRSVCFLGDDVGDLPAFAALDRLAAAGVHTVKVAVSTEEAPVAVLEGADVVVDGPQGALALLEWLVARLRQTDES
jgi:trehalose 6-phosphate phosphatase